MDHCKSQDFDAVELITSENHEVARLSFNKIVELNNFIDFLLNLKVFLSRSLYYKKGFELIGSYQKRFAGGLVGLYMFQLQKRLKAKEGSTDEVIG